jgi:hypothetical protein
MTRYTLDVEGMIWTITAADLDDLMSRIVETFVPGMRVELIAADRI